MSILSAAKKLFSSAKKLKKSSARLRTFKGIDVPKFVVSDIDSTLWFKGNPLGPCRFAVYSMWKLSKKFPIIYLSGRENLPKGFTKFYPKGILLLREKRHIPNFIWKRENLIKISKRGKIVLFFDNSGMIIDKAKELGIPSIKITGTEIWERFSQKFK